MANRSGIEYLRKIYVKLRKIYLSNFLKLYENLINTIGDLG